MSATMHQMPQLQPRELQLRDRLIDLAVESQAQGYRMQAHGGQCKAQAETVLRAAHRLADAARELGGHSGGHPTLNLYFPDDRARNGSK